MMIGFRQHRASPRAECRPRERRRGTARVAHTHGLAEAERLPSSVCSTTV